MILTISVITIMIAIHIALAKLVHVKIYQYLYPWFNGPLPTPLQRLKIAGGGLLAIFALAFVLIGLDILGNPQRNNEENSNIVVMTMTEIKGKAIHSARESLQHAGFIREGEHTFTGVQHKPKRSTTKLAAHMFLDVFFYLSLPFPPLNGGAIIIALAELVRKKPFDKETLQSATIIGLLQLFLLNLIIII